MWGTVLLTALVVSAYPRRIWAVVYLVSWTKPLRPLLGYLIGGFGVSLIFGAGVLIGLTGAGIGASSSLPPEIEIAAGALALLAAGFVGTGGTIGLGTFRRARRAPGQGAVGAAIPASERRPGPEQLPGFAKLPGRAQDALRNESPLVALIVGLVAGLPGAFYLAAIAAILNAEVGIGTQVGALLVFNVVAFAQAEIPILRFLVAPEQTRARVAQLHTWTTVHRRVILAALAAAVGSYLVLTGISNL